MKRVYIAILSFILLGVSGARAAIVVTEVDFASNTIETVALLLSLHYYAGG